LLAPPHSGKLPREEVVMADVFVVGVDESDHAIYVLDKALEEAERFGAELHVVHVAHLPTAYFMAFGAEPLNTAEIMEKARQALWARLEPHLSRRGVVVEKVDLEGYPPDTLVDYTKNVTAKRLIIGTRGRGEVAALVLGSTSHRALHLARCDVLVVKPV